MSSSDFYLISGYWTDNGEDFDGYLMCSHDALCENEHDIIDDDVFFYGLSRAEAEASIGEESNGDFAITGVEDYE